MPTRPNDRLLIDMAFIGLSYRARLLLLAAHALADSRGVVPGDPRWLKAYAFAGDDISLIEVSEMVRELQRSGLVKSFVAEQAREQIFLVMNLPKSSQRTKWPAPPKSADKALATALSDPDILEAHDPAANGQATVATVPLKDPRLVFVIRPDYAASLRAKYPQIDVAFELRELVAWNHRNPERRKTPSGVRSHVETWLSRAARRAQQAGRRSGAANAANNRGHRASQKVVTLAPRITDPEHGDAMSAFDEMDDASLSSSGARS